MNIYVGSFYFTMSRLTTNHSYIYRYSGLHSDSAALSLTPNGPRSVILGSEAALCLVDIDKPDIQLPEELPIFPHRTPLIEELNHILDKHQVI